MIKVFTFVGSYNQCTVGREINGTIGPVSAAFSQLHHVLTIKYEVHSQDQDLFLRDPLILWLRIMATKTKPREEVDALDSRCITTTTSEFISNKEVKDPSSVKANSSDQCDLKSASGLAGS